MAMFEADANSRQSGGEVLRGGVDLVEARTTASEGSGNLVDQDGTRKTPVQSLSNLAMCAVNIG